MILFFVQTISESQEDTKIPMQRVRLEEEIVFFHMPSILAFTQASPPAPNEL